MNYRCRNIAIVLFLLTLSLQSFSQKESHLHRIPFEKAAGLMLVTATLDDIKGNFIFDTASDAIVINSKEQSGKCNSKLIQTVQGELQVCGMKFKKLSLGTLVLKNVEAITSDLSTVENHVGSEILGIIGAQLLDSEVIKIDVINRSLELYDRKEVESSLSNTELRVPLTFENDVPVIALHIGAQSYNFILDSGASVSLIDNSLVDFHNELFEKTNRSFDLVTAAGSQECFYYYSDALLFGSVVLQDQKMAAVDMSYAQESFAIPISGIISLDHLPFDYLLVDYKNGWLYVN